MQVRTKTVRWLGMAILGLLGCLWGGVAFAAMGTVRSFTF